MAADPVRQRLPLRHRGFSLTELMITLAIIAVIAAIALPSYEGSIRKSRRADAKSALTQIAQRLERCYTQFGAYNDANCAVASPQNSPDGHYSVVIARTATTFTLTATAQGTQAADTACAGYTLNHQGTRTPTPGGADRCW